MEGGFNAIVADQFEPRQGWKDFSALFGLGELNPNGELAWLAVNLHMDLWQVDAGPHLRRDLFDQDYPDKYQSIVQHRWEVFKGIYTAIGFSLENPHLVRPDVPPLQISNTSYSVPYPKKGRRGPAKDLYDWAVFTSCSASVESIKENDSIDTAQKAELIDLAHRIFAFYDLESDDNFQELLLGLPR